MSEFKTVGPTRFGVGDGATRKFSVGRPGDVVQSANIESVRKVGWQGDVLLSPRPRTNLVLFSNDFNNLAWKGSPSLYADFTTGNMPPGIDFSRASTATYWDKEGILREADVDEPRFDHDPVTGEALGLLRERALTNYVEDNTNFSLTSANFNSVPVSDPVMGEAVRVTAVVDGEGSAGVAINGVIYNLSPIDTSPGILRVIYAKPDTADYVSLRYVAGPHGITVKLSTAEIVQTMGASITPYVRKLSGGWVEISFWDEMSATSQGARTGYYVLFGSTPKNVANGQGIEYKTGDSVFLAYPSMYQALSDAPPQSIIKTYGTRVTRAAEVISYANADNSPLFPNGEFSAVIDFDTEEKPVANRQAFSLSGAANLLSVFQLYSNNSFYSRFPNTSSSPFLGLDSGRQKIALASTSTRKSGSKSGEETRGHNIQIDYIGDIIQVNFTHGFGTQNYNGHLRSFQLYNRALPDTKLQELSSI